VRSTWRAEQTTAHSRCQATVTVMVQTAQQHAGPVECESQCLPESVLFWHQKRFSFVQGAKLGSAPVCHGTANQALVDERTWSHGHHQPVSRFPPTLKCVIAVKSASSLGRDPDRPTPHNSNARTRPELHTLTPKHLEGSA
jgi:hypothetical protein